MSDDELRRHTRALLKVETEAQGELDNREIDLDLNDPAQVAEAKARAIRHREALDDLIAALDEAERRHAERQARKNGRGRW